MLYTWLHCRLFTGKPRNVISRRGRPALGRKKTFADVTSDGEQKDLENSGELAGWKGCPGGEVIHGEK